MPTLHELIAGRLTATGVSPAMAARIASLIEQDLHATGHCVVKTSQIDFFQTELVNVTATLRMLSAAFARIEQPWPMPKERG